MVIALDFYILAWLSRSTCLWAGDTRLIQRRGEARVIQGALTLVVSKLGYAMVPVAVSVD